MSLWRVELQDTSIHYSYLYWKFSTINVYYFPNKEKKMLHKKQTLTGGLGLHPSKDRKLTRSYDDNAFPTLVTPQKNVS